MRLVEDYLANQVEKLPLGQVARAFKGKAVSSKADPGRVSYINLSDMTEFGIDYQNLKTFDEEIEKLQKYLLETGDVLVASKGTVKKVAVFEEQLFPVVASSNITVLRPSETLSGFYLKLFLESEVGQALLDTADHGKGVLNISTAQLLEIPIPQIPLVKQDYLVQYANRGRADYQRKIARAQQEWQYIKEEVEKNLY
ncbi:restriction endonuclease subunit S [Streptococcus tangpeifui]|uniref:restriction endonuclease subunit S n=1 Tax=Streptococcus tangpeifui TaxID=2709400 RepID=UPI0013E9D537|nr:restriction endonuclease subunit S [Streptococcus sp. ZJ373]